MSKLSHSIRESADFLACGDGGFKEDYNIQLLNDLFKF